MKAARVETGEAFKESNSDLVKPFAIPVEPEDS